MRQLLLVATVLAAVGTATESALAGPVRLKGGAKAEEKLRRFVSEDKKLASRIQDAVRREEAFVAEARESDLRDAVSDRTVEDLHASLEQSSGEKRKSILESMPGMKAVSGPACAALADCVNPPMTMEVPDARNLQDAMRVMIRPWMTLQQARGSEIEVVTAEGASDAALTVKLKGVDAEPLSLHVSPHLLGGFTVWYDHPAMAAALYERERKAVLK